MRINNSFTTGFPVVHNNGDFIVNVPTNALTDLKFELVDANYKPVKLLNPMYISILIEGIPDDPLFNVNEEPIQNFTHM